ncbi:MAG: hypothetical protein FWF09_05865, partial [Bacteroidales bacterium]|nr:hypothetical protein [Bacteroidales bacterium]
EQATACGTIQIDHSDVNVVNIRKFISLKIIHLMRKTVEVGCSFVFLVVKNTFDTASFYSPNSDI